MLAKHDEGGENDWSEIVEQRLGPLAARYEQHEPVRSAASDYAVLAVLGWRGNVWFMAECMCFIFKWADDYYRSPECQNWVDPVPEGLYLQWSSSYYLIMDSHIQQTSREAPEHLLPFALKVRGVGL